MIKAELIGLENINKVIQSLPKELGQYAIQSATLSAATVIQKALKNAAPRSRKSDKYQNKWKYGHLADNIKKKRTENANLVTTYQVYVPRKIYWAKWLEEGLPVRPAVAKRNNELKKTWTQTKKGKTVLLTRRTKKFSIGRMGSPTSRVATIGGRTVTIKNTGSMPARPFFHQTVNRVFPQARQKMIDVIWDRTQKAIKNLSGRFGKYKGRVSKSKRIF